MAEALLRAGRPKPQRHQPLLDQRVDLRAERGVARVWAGREGASRAADKRHRSWPVGSCAAGGAGSGRGVRGGPAHQEASRDGAEQRHEPAGVLSVAARLGHRATGCGAPRRAGNKAATPPGRSRRAWRPTRAASAGPAPRSLRCQAPKQCQKTGIAGGGCVQWKCNRFECGQAPNGGEAGRHGRSRLTGALCTPAAAPPQPHVHAELVANPAPC